jgi:hypothetical protein
MVGSRFRYSNPSAGQSRIQKAELNAIFIGLGHVR